MRRFNTAVFAAVCLAVFALPEIAFAERKNPLDDQPAVRHRKLLVKQRFEVAAAFENTVNTDFKHTSAFGLKLEYHLTDMLSFGAVGFYGISYDTALTDKIVSTLPNSSDMGDPTPTTDQFSDHLNEVPLHGAAYVSVTPWYGKLAAFGRFFVNFDFYFQGGLSVASLSNECCDRIGTIDQNPGEVVMNPDGTLRFPDDDPNNDPALNDGTKIGLYLGGGIHVFINDWIALDLTVRDYMFSDNPSGLDFDADKAVTDDDNRFLNHLYMGIGASFFLPPKVKRTE